MLTDKQEAFCVALLDHTQTDAYRIAYPRQRMTPNTLAANASRLAANSKIAARLEQLRAQLAARTSATLARTVQEIAAVAYSDIGEAVAWDGERLRVRAFDEMDERARRAIQSIKVTRSRREGEDEDAWETEQVEVKLHPKLPATDQLMKHLGGYPKEQRGGDTFVDARSINFGPVAQLSIDELRALAAQDIEEE